MKSQEEQLEEIIRAQDWLMCCLGTVRELDLPDWYIAAGAIRTTVWNHFHQFPGDFFQKDIDVIYFDPSKSRETDAIIEQELYKKMPNQHWEVVNQVYVHLFEITSNKKPVISSADSIGYWSETPTCIGIRLEVDDSMTICAPYGLDDLLDLKVRPIPMPKQNLELYTQRYYQKAWLKTWPKLDIQEPNDSNFTKETISK